MGEYAVIKVGKINLYWFKNYLQSEHVCMFFSEKDLIITEQYYSDPDDEDCEPITKYEYKTTVKKARERLDALGYGIKRMGKIFDDRKYEAINYDDFLFHLNGRHNTNANERIKKNITFNKWVNAVSKITKYELEHGNIEANNNEKPEIITTEADKVIYYDLISDYGNSFYGLYTDVIPEGYIYRLILEACDENEEIILDFTYLQYWDENSIPKAIEAVKQVERTIVLVEGTSDKAILEFAMSKIYPHLSDLFYFMDFDDGHGHSRSNSGASEIKKCVETFYYSKIKAKFVAIFDNDAEGYSSKLDLEAKIKNCPDNFRITCYPRIEAFVKYPMLMPNGKVEYDDIDKKACSIELYLPDCVIKDNDEYYPIEWKSRIEIKQVDKKVYFYQGVISEKDTIKKWFFELKNGIESGKKEFDNMQWQRMQTLLKSIVFAFVE